MNPGFIAVAFEGEPRHPQSLGDPVSCGQSRRQLEAATDDRIRLLPPATDLKQWRRDEQKHLPVMVLAENHLTAVCGNRHPGDPPGGALQHQFVAIFGGFGSTAQHSYFQLLHQGTASACADIFTIESNKGTNKLLYAQSQAQSGLLSNGPHEALESFEQVNGNIPTNLFTLKELNPRTLGFLIATWEHRTYVTAKMLQINPFDQYGVSAGKIFAKKYLDEHGG